MRVFDRAGPHNTDESLKIAIEQATRRGLPLVVASTKGGTARRASELLPDGLKLIVVTHNTGFSEPGVQEFDESLRVELESRGATVHTGTMPLRGLGSAIRKRLGGSEEELLACALRLFCQGAKVCVEMASMVADAGLVGAGQDIITVAGTRTGADTACVIRPMPSNRLLETKVLELLCKPGEF